MEELNQIVNEWESVLNKTLSDPDSLNEEEKQTLQILTSFGIVNAEGSESTLGYFLTVQSQLISQK